MSASPRESPACLDWAFAEAALDGAQSGDLHVVVPLQRGALLGDIDVDQPPQSIADEILARWAPGSDDALVLVARILGGPP
jgi:hypothetical protein